MEEEDKKEKRQVYELILGDDDLTDGVSTISFVQEPAHESKFMYFSKEDIKEYKFGNHEEKMMVFGAALIPDQLIVRKGRDGEEPYDVFFSKETIEKSQELYFKRSQHTKSNVDHMLAVDGISVVESWIKIDDNDKSKTLGLDLPDGTWVVGYKVDNEALWEGVKSGAVTGFSIEGQFVEDAIEMSKLEEKVEVVVETIEPIVKTDDQIVDELKIILNDDISDDEKKEKLKELLK